VPGAGATPRRIGIKTYGEGLSLVKDRITTWWHWLLLSYTALLLVLLIGQLAAAAINWKLLLLQWAMLLAFLPGLLSGNGKACILLSCLLLLFTAKFVSDLIVSQWSWVSIVQTLCTLTLFICLIGYLRARGKLSKPRHRARQT